MLTSHIIVCLSSHRYENQCTYWYHINKLHKVIAGFLVVPSIECCSLGDVECREVHHHNIDTRFIRTMFFAVD